LLVMRRTVNRCVSPFHESTEHFPRQAEHR